MTKKFKSSSKSTGNKTNISVHAGADFNSQWAANFVKSLPVNKRKLVNPEKLANHLTHPDIHGNWYTERMLNYHESSPEFKHILSEWIRIFHAVRSSLVFDFNELQVAKGLGRLLKDYFATTVDRMFTDSLIKHGTKFFKHAIFKLYNNKDIERLGQLTANYFFIEDRGMAPLFGSLYGALGEYNLVKGDVLLCVQSHPEIREQIANLGIRTSYLGGLTHNKMAGYNDYYFVKNVPERINFLRLVVPDIEVMDMSYLYIIDINDLNTRGLLIGKDEWIPF